MSKQEREREKEREEAETWGLEKQLSQDNLNIYIYPLASLTCFSSSLILASATESRDCAVPSSTTFGGDILSVTEII